MTARSYRWVGPIIVGALHALPAAGADMVPMHYALPDVRVAFGVSHTLEQCPEAGRPARVATVAAIKPVYVAGDEITIDASADFLVKRGIRMSFHPNGTLKSINAESEGQGGAVVAAAIKAAAFVGSLAIGGPPVGALTVDDQPARSGVACHPWVKAAVDSLDRTERNLRALEDQAAVSASPALLAQIAQLRDTRAALRSRLTISSDPAVFNFRDNATGKDIARANFGTWFTGGDSVLPQLRAMGIVGLDGFRAEVTAVAVPSGSQPSAPNSAIKAIWFREPARYRAVLKPQGSFACAGAADHCAQASQIWNATTVTSTVAVPQKGVVRTLPFTGSGLFGSRAVSASFADDGSLLELGFTSAGGAAALAGVIDASVAAATTLRDAELAALKRTLDREKTQAELLELLEAKAKED